MAGGAKAGGREAAYVCTFETHGVMGEVAILVSSHVLAEIERVADRAAILLDGRLLDVLPLDGMPAGGLEQVFLRLTANEPASRPIEWHA